MDKNEKYQHAKFVTLIGVVVNTLLAVLKVLFGIFGHSQSLLVDGLHSFSDLLTDFLVLFAAKIANQDADVDHPYGHARFETLGSVALSALLIVMALVFLYEAVVKIHLGLYPQKPSLSVIIVAAISVIANEFLFRYTLQYAKKIRSNLLSANAWHSRSDALSSFVVLVGVTCALAGYPFFDSIAAIIVSLLIIKMGIELGWQGLRELVDTGLDEPMLARLREEINCLPGVNAVHQLRTRFMAGDIILDVHVQVDKYLTVSEGHYIAELVRNYLITNFAHISDVTVHIDPEDDEMAPLVAVLPPRRQVILDIRNACGQLPGFYEIKSLHLHYLHGKIEIEFGFSSALQEQLTDNFNLAQEYSNALAVYPYCRKINVIFIQEQEQELN